MKGLPEPNYTQAPNVLFDALPDIRSLAELKVTFVIVRATIGWHRDEQRLSVVELMKLTGLSKTSVLDGLERALERGTVERRIEGAGGARESFYTLNLVGQDSVPTSVKELDQPRSSIPTNVGPEAAPTPTTRAREARKETEKKETTPPNPLASEGEQAKWDSFIKDIAANVPEMTFASFYKRLRLVERRDDTLVVTTDDGASIVLRARHIDFMEQVAKGSYGPAITIEVQVPDQLERERERKRQREQLSQRAPRRRRPPGRAAL